MTDFEMTAAQQGHMVDTVIFGDLVGRPNYKLLLNELPTVKLWATLVQYEELKATRDPVRRQDLLTKFHELKPQIATALFSWNVPGAGWDHGYFGSQDELIFAEKIRTRLDQIFDLMPRRKQNRAKKENNLPDSLIATAAKFNNLGLITRDDNLFKVATEFNISVLNPSKAQHTVEMP
jgi:hypothetical protein